MCIPIKPLSMWVGEKPNYERIGDTQESGSYFNSYVWRVKPCGLVGCNKSEVWRFWNVTKSEV